MRAILKNTARERANQNARKPVSPAARVIIVYTQRRRKGHNLKERIARVQFGYELNGRKQ